MKKIINPGSVKIGETYAPVFCKIEYNDGRISISGVEGPLKSGNARGSCGQMYDGIIEAIERDLWKPEAATGWTNDSAREFVRLWKLWHLNDMKPECEHQRAAGWPEMAAEKIITYIWTLKPEIYSQKKALEDEAIERARSVDPGRSVGFSDHEKMIMRLEYEIKSDAPEIGAHARYYQAARQHTKEESRGWVRFSEDARGLLCKPCEVCGYEYGSEWKRQDVPHDVLNWLFALPDTKKEPAWV